MTDRIIHVRFAPNGAVTDIGARPASLPPQQWFDFLYRRRVSSYQTYAGGRGVFRLSSGEVEALAAEATRPAA